MTAASLYVRLSRESSAANTSLEGMIADCRALAEREGLDVFAVHVDEGISGAVRDRPEFVAWLDDARRGDVSTLIAYHSDRVTREGVNAAAIALDVIEGKDSKTGAIVRPPVRFLSVDGLDSQRDAEAFRWRFVIAAEVARAERERIKARNKATQKRLREQGRFTGGAVPYGTRVVERTVEGGKVGRFLECDPIEAEHLRIAAWRLIRGDGFRETVAFMNAQGWKTRRGYPWQRSSLRYALLSPPARDHVFDAATYRALRERLEPRFSSAPKSKGGRPSKLLLRGLLVCSDCGRPLTTHPRQANGKVYTRYSCQTNGSQQPCADRVTVAADALDDFVEREFLNRWGSFEHVEPRVMLMDADELNEAEKEVQLATDALLADPTNPDNGARLVAARARLDEIRARPVRRETVLVSTGKTIADVWQESMIPERRVLLAGMLATSIVVRPARDYPTKRGGSRGGAQLNPERVVLVWRGDEQLAAS